MISIHNRTTLHRLVGAFVAAFVGWAALGFWEGGFLCLVGYLTGLGYADENPRTR